MHYSTRTVANIMPKINVKRIFFKTKQLKHYEREYCCMFFEVQCGISLIVLPCVGRKRDFILLVALKVSMDSADRLPSYYFFWALL